MAISYNKVYVLGYDVKNQNIWWISNEITSLLGWIISSKAEHHCRKAFKHLRQIYSSFYMPSFSSSLWRFLVFLLLPSLRSFLSLSCYKLQVLQMQAWSWQRSVLLSACMYVGIAFSILPAYSVAESLSLSVFWTNAACEQKRRVLLVIAPAKQKVNMCARMGFVRLCAYSMCLGTHVC